MTGQTSSSSLAASRTSLVSMSSPRTTMCASRSRPSAFSRSATVRASTSVTCRSGRIVTRIRHSLSSRAQGEPPRSPTSRFERPPSKPGPGTELYDGRMLDGAMTARRYHDLSKHRRGRRLGGRMDPANRPLPFKVYRDVPLLPFAESWDTLTEPATEALSGQGPLTRRQPTRADVERVCRFSNGVLRWRQASWLPGGRMAFRAAPCTGALYHIELYLACTDIEGLPAGLYQYCARDSGFRRLRGGDWRAVLIEAAAGEMATAEAPAVLLMTSTFWRNAWKYGARAYRHTYWDGGVVLANALAAAQALQLRATVVMGFVDAAVNALIDIEPDREAAIAMVPLGEGAPAPRPRAAPPERLGLVTEPLSPFEER